MKKLTTLICTGALTAMAGAAQTTDQLTNIPTVYVVTDNSAPINSKEIYTTGTVTVASGDEAQCCTDVAMGIRGRGNSTWGMPKKPFRIKFDKKQRFLNNNANAKNWVLLANYADKTLLRNAIAFEISSFVGMEYTPSITFVDLVVNGEYLGNYMVTDQTEVKEGRVPVEEQEITDTEEPAITGGYLLEIDGFADSEPVWFTTGQGLKITIKYPKDDEINDAQQKYITDFTQKFENALFSENFTDPETGYRSMVDEESLVNWYIACELTGNSDSFWSTYIYKKRNDDRFYFGPLWDFDIAFNNDDRLGEATRKLMREHAHDPKTWISRIWKDQWFRTAVNTRWAELVEAGIEEELLAKVDYYATLIDKSQTMNFEKWNVLPNKVYHETYLFNTYKGGVDKLKEYITDRVAFLSESFADTDPSMWAVDIDTDCRYKIRHSGGLWMAETTDNLVLAEEENAHEFTFVPSPENPGYYGMQLPSGRFGGSDNSWNVRIFDDFTDPYSLFTVERSQEAGYVIIKNLGQNAYLGTDRNSAGSAVYTDKKADDIKHLWKLFEIRPVSGVEMEKAAAAIYYKDNTVAAPGATAVTLYDTAGKTVARTSGDTLGTSALAKGIYIAVATMADGSALRLKLTK